MLTLAILLFAISPAEPLAPPTALALDLAEAIGPTVRVIDLQTDPSINPDERDAITIALKKTGLFVFAPEAPNTVTIGRIDPNVLLTRVETKDGRRLWVGRTSWPQSDAPKSPPPDPEERYRRVLAYRRVRLSLAPVLRTFWQPVEVMGYVHQPLHTRGRPDGYNAAWGFGAENLAYPHSTTIPAGWVILEGHNTRLDELEFARRIGDIPLAQKIATTRQRTRRAWGLGFGAGALAALGTGGYLLWSDAGPTSSRRDIRTSGASLMTLGVVSGVLALLYDRVAQGPVQSTQALQERIDKYNRQLRQQHGVSLTDLSEFPETD